MKKYKVLVGCNYKIYVNCHGNRSVIVFKDSHTADEIMLQLAFNVVTATALSIVIFDTFTLLGNVTQE
jgi:hypothetical protein